MNVNFNFTTPNEICFDMDGTIADLYAVENWLPKLRAFDPSPYADASPMWDMDELAAVLNALRANGMVVTIITWLSQESTSEYDELVRQAKREWLAKHLPSVEWDAIEIVPYGTPKHEICGSGILFDDEARNRDNWTNSRTGIAFEPEHISEILSMLGKC
jgi:hypothetical protein